jgi:hypothetical protein
MLTQPWSYKPSTGGIKALPNRVVALYGKGCVPAERTFTFTARFDIDAIFLGEYSGN